MNAYMIAFVRIEDFDSYNHEYLQVAHPIVTKYGGKALVVSDNVKVLEGSIPKGKIVIVEFPSMNQAENFYASPEYQPLIAIRNKYTSSDAAIAENQIDPSKM